MTGLNITHQHSIILQT